VVLASVIEILLVEGRGPSGVAHPNAATHKFFGQDQNLGYTRGLARKH